MKGVVFTEFLDMVDEKFGVDTTEDLITGAQLPSGGAYTAVGTYDHGELVALVGNLSAATGTDVPELVRAFGRHLAGRFAGMFPDFFAVPDVLAFLENVDGYIHGEVRKLYPDAALPTLTSARTPGGGLELTYRSDRRMADLAEGLIEGALAHFGDTHSCRRDDLPDEKTSQCARFVLTPRA